ncbi:glycerophosphoryl diester phosphodiesterase membrane domain-containing protein [Pedococcus sp. KACC 23699]|uniref:Glycerophosphoryl diester phosphodiesterase membrane domain-containing protein n=1 Tax=Pedococcus sp. KACC 23699 TaxID=3149228 RepID=A0AAU7JW91_9MICO
MSDTEGRPGPETPSVHPSPSWSAPGPTPPTPSWSAPGPIHPSPSWSAPGSPAATSPSPQSGPGRPGQPAPQDGPGQPSPQPYWTTALTAHKPGIIALRPLGFGDILEGAFAAMRRNPRTFFGLALLTSLAVLLLLAAVGALGYLVVSQVGSSGAADVFLAIGTIGGFTLLYVASAVTSVALTGMLSYPVGEAVLGRKPSIGETWRRTRGMLPRLTGLCLILFIPVVIVFAGLVALVIVAFDHGSNVAGAAGIVALVAALVAMAYVGVRLALATPALVLEELAVVAALRRSWALTRGRFWRTLGVLFVSSLIVGVVQQVLGFGFQIVGAALGVAFTSTVGGQAGDVGFAVVLFGVTVVGSLLASLLAQPFLAAVGALLYTDARIRKEGFDLALVRAATGARVTG